MWLTFSGGGVLAAIFLPILAVLFGFAFPLGWVSAPDHDHLAAVIGHPLTRLVLFGMFVAMLVTATHRYLLRAHARPAGVGELEAVAVRLQRHTFLVRSRHPSAGW